MNDRLKLIYSKIPQGKGLLDVGTDHGYLPIALALNGYSGAIIASDINQPPLSTAEKNAREQGVFNRISFILADGIEPDCLSEVDTIVIAGMGGDTICHILDRAYECISRNHLFILQPMSKPEILRYWLINNGFRINDESPVYDNGRIYSVITTVFTGINSALSDCELFTGKKDLIENSSLYDKLIGAYIQKFERINAGSGNGSSLNSSILNDLKSHYSKEK